MGLENIVKKARNYRSKNKRYMDVVLDPLAFLVGSNGVSLYYGNELLSYVNDSVQANRGLAMMGTYLGLGTALYFANKHVLVPIAKKLASRQVNKIKRKRESNLLSWGKTIGVTASLLAAYHLSDFRGTLGDYYYDGKRILQAFQRDKEVAYYEVPNTLQKLVPKNLDPELVRKSDKRTVQGKFYRTIRWDEIINDAEDKYGIPEGLMSGLAMRESSGDPLQLNRGGDGGVGMWQFQPGTAKEYGLKVYGNSSATGRDRRHGRDMRELFIDSGWNYDAIAALDERVDVRKSTDAAGRFLRDLYRRHNDWDDALSAYNRGSPARHPERTDHVRGTRRNQDYYNEHKKEFLN